MLFLLSSPCKWGFYLAHQQIIASIQLVLENGPLPDDPKLLPLFSSEKPSISHSLSLSWFNYVHLISTGKSP
ncbi:hypothetical protein [Legionella sp. 16cNR16C]|uniref:hypothetical protein n=1 Tax=Legionella sp. 16cNR16C TaxID=2905656 RepID=UPI001E4E4FB6|nr:hypothetical protein [Legionella sp. 16cNR16C]MCE3045363.1 hypothetical protein [Legionella sp. 16cNR16C]